MDTNTALKAIESPKGITFGGYYFKTKKALTEDIRRRVSEVRPGEVLLGDNTEFFMQLIAARHRHASVKLKKPIREFFIKTGKYGVKQIWIRYEDLSDNDFSWVSCVTPRSAKTDALAAGRDAISDQIEEFINTRTEFRCAITGEIVPAGRFDVDHFPVSFIDLFNSWLIGEGFTYSSIEVNTCEDRSTVTYMTCALQKTGWQDYHRLFSSLRILERSAHQARRRK